MLGCNVVDKNEAPQRIFNWKELIRKTKSYTVCVGPDAKSNPPIVGYPLLDDSSESSGDYGEPPATRPSSRPDILNYSH